MHSSPTALAIAALLFCSTAYSQSEDAAPLRHEINVGYFNAFSISGSNQLQVGYKLHGKNGAMRLILGGDYSTSISLDDPTNQLSKVSAVLQTRVGYQKNRQVPGSDRFMLFYGADAVLSTEDHYLTRLRITNNGLDPAITQETTSSQVMVSGGGSPFIGLRYQATRGVSISTEMGFSALWTATTTDQTNTFDGIRTNTRQRRNDINVGRARLGIITINFHL